MGRSENRNDVSTESKREERFRGKTKEKAWKRNDREGMSPVVVSFEIKYGAWTSNDATKFNSLWTLVFEPIRFFSFFFFETKREFLCRSQSAPCIYAFPLHRHGYVYKASRLDSWKEIEFRRRERERVLFNRDCCDCCALHARDIQCWNSVVSSFFLRGTGGGNFSLFIATIAHLLCPRPLFPYRRCRRIFRTSFDLRRKGSSFFDIITFYWNVLVE